MAIRKIKLTNITNCVKLKLVFVYVQEAIYGNFNRPF